ncbi:MAG TPA: hypothetical protein VGQ83_13295 [Polyangia bacterium]|jgi:hypothetical protein
MRALALALAALAAGCGSSSPTGAVDAGRDGPAAQLDAQLPADGPAATDAAATDGTANDAGGDAGAACPRSPAAADRTRYVVVSHPYSASGQANTFQVLTLSQAGTLATTATTFEMGRAGRGEIAFTPDGVVGIAVQDDGTLGAFTIDAAGAVTVKHAAYDDGVLYAERVVMDPSGAFVWVLDDQWRTNGGGIYRVRINCDGTLTSEGLYTAAKLAGQMLLLPGGPARAVVAAYDVLESSAPNDTHLIDLTDPPTLVGSADGFPAVGGAEEAFLASAALTSDGKYALVGDNSEFSGIPNRVAVIEVTTTSLIARQVLSPVPDPVSLVASPFGGPVLAIDGYGNAIHKLTYDPSNASAPFTIAGEIAYSGAKPQLPDAAVLIRRGALEGRVLIAENVGVHQVAFHGDGTVTDLGMTPAGGTGNGAIVGAIGVQP